MDNGYDKFEGQSGRSDDKAFAEQSADVLRVETYSSGCSDHAEDQSASHFKDNVFRTRFLQVLLIIGLALWGVAVIAGFFEYNLLQKINYGMFTSEEELDAAANRSDLVMGVIGLGQMLLGFLTLIFFFMWVYRSNKNTSALTGEEMEFTPGWAVGWFFVPIACLWKPYQAIKEIWAICSKHSGLTGAWIVSLWWTFHLLSFSLSKAVFKMQMRAEEIDELIRVSMLSIVSDGVDIIWKIIILILVSKIFLMQKQIQEQHIKEKRINIAS